MLHVLELQPRLFAPPGQCGEILAARLGTIHNLHFYLSLMRTMREAIEERRFDAFARAFYRSRAREAPDRNVAPPVTRSAASTSRNRSH